jgi:hypothetical protein
MTATKQHVTLTCYLLREDKQYYALGHSYMWRLTFGVFPGPADGSVCLKPEDAPLLALRLDVTPSENLPVYQLLELASDIIRWADGKSFRFVSEPDPEIEPGVEPAPITGRMP